MYYFDDLGDVCLKEDIGLEDVGLDALMMMGGELVVYVKLVRGLVRLVRLAIGEVGLILIGSRSIKGRMYVSGGLLLNTKNCFFDVLE